MKFCRRPDAIGFLICVVWTTLAFGTESLPPVQTNENHQPGGILSQGVLSLQLQIARGEWHPEAENGMGLSVYAFGEEGHPLQNPGPLIRVPQGTQVRISLRNQLNVPVTVHGLADSGVDSALHLAPGASTQIEFKATTPGLFFYWGSTAVDDLKLRHGIDSELTGAIVVDPSPKAPKDEIFVMEMMSERPGANARQTLATINGKSWPYTQRFRYQPGEQVHWRWINATNEPHALHLHGFYYRIDAFNRGGRVQTFEGDSRPRVVTQRIVQGETFDMSWSPERPGQWLFHCHMVQHMNPPVVPAVQGLEIRDAEHNRDEHGSMADRAGMGQLVLGITVPGISEVRPAAEWHAKRKLQLEISPRPAPPLYALQLREATAGATSTTQPGLLGPPIILTRGEPVEIEIINRLKEPTAIHWHGIELESYYDGVPGWSGADKQITPAIPPGSSFIARMIPPRAGTFIYHTHWHDSSQLVNGLYGPLLVLPPGENYDAESDLPFVFSIGDYGALGELALLNGTPAPADLKLKAGKKYRFRFINISTNNQGMQIVLRNPGGLAEWTVIAKDGADLPVAAVHPAKADLTVTVGETYDVEFVSKTEQDWLLDLLRPALKMHTIQNLSFVKAEEKVSK